MRKFFILLIAFCLTACQQKKGDTLQVQMPVAPQNPSDQMGTGDSGGGNGINGKALESHRIDVTALPEYHQFVLPALLRIQKVLPLLAHELEYIALKRNWYFVPVPLKNLSQEQIGVGFATDQIALQTHRNIWMDNRHYSKMNPKERGVILLHEMVMGLKILAWSSPIDKCFASAVTKTQKNSCSVLNTAFSDEEIFLFFVQNRKIKLKPEDYDEIRKVTGDLINNTEPKTFDQLVSWIKAIRRYSTEMDRYNSLKIHEKWLTPMSVSASLQALSLQRKLPRFGGFEEIAPDAKSTTSCHLKFQIDLKSNSIVAHFAEQRNSDKSWSNNFEMKIDPFSLEFEDSFVGIRKTVTLAEQVLTQPKTGDTRRSITFTFLGDKVESYSVDTEVYTKIAFDEYSEETWEEVESFERRGDRFIPTGFYCYDKSNYQIDL
jgi:hypothetical protein